MQSDLDSIRNACDVFISRIHVLRLAGRRENWNSPIKALKGVLQRESEVPHDDDDDCYTIH